MNSSLSETLLLYSPQRLYDRGLTLIGVLLTLQDERGSGPWFLLTESSKIRLLEQRPLSCKTLLIPATGIDLWFEPFFAKEIMRVIEWLW
jgi:hypothetical protein